MILFCYLILILNGLVKANLEDSKNRLVRNSIVKEIVKNEFLNVYQKIQSKKKTLCMAGSFYHNGSCFYFSNRNEKLSWLLAERFCRKLPFNTSLLVIQNDEKLEFVRKSLVKIKQVESPADQLVFLIGFYQRNDAWIWTNLKKVEEYNLSIIEEWPEVNSTHGGCGSVALNKLHQVIFKSAPCLYVSSRFICEYSLNPCAVDENLCGKNGKCVNLYGKFYCDCQAVSYFHTGKYCEKLNGKAVQTIIGLCIICILFIIFMITTLIRYFKNKKRLKEENQDEYGIKFKQIEPRPSYIRQISKIVSQKSNQFRSKIKKVGIRTYLIGFFKRSRKYFKNRDRNYYNILRFFLILTLTIMQVAFIHWDNAYFRLNDLFLNSNQQVQTNFCRYLSKYLFEELIYSVLVILICILIYFCKTKRPYSYFIMRKYRNYFESKHYEQKINSTRNKKLISKNKSLSTISPASQFSIRRRKISSAVYVIYTYDVLNVLMSVYTDNINSSLFSFSFIVISGGVIIDFLFQIVQVLFIGFKYYPILVVADLPDPNMFLYFVCMLYLTFIWVIRFFNKAVCSQKQEFARQTLVKLSSNLNEKIMNGIKLRYNLTNKLLSLFTDDPNPNEQYLKALKQLIPNIFKSTFGKYEPNMIENYKSIILIDGLSTPNNYYYDTTTHIPLYSKSNKNNVLLATSQLSTDRFRDILLNKTNMNVDILIEDLSKKFDQKWKFSISFMENLPLYISLSYLLTQFSLMFIGSLIDKLAHVISSRLNKRKIRIANKISEGKQVIFRNLNSDDTQMDVDPDESDPINPAHQILKQNSSGFSKQKKEINQNYEYVKRIIKKLNVFDFSGNINQEIDKQTIKSKKQKSFFINLFEKHVYKNKRYLRYSKQFLNTITVALMIIYFFNLYIIKLSDTLCDLLARLINFLLKYLFSGFIQSFNIDLKHDFKIEFRIACLLTSLVILVQLFQTVRKFHDDLIKLHKFSNFSNLIENYSENYKKMVRKKNNELFKNSVVNNSLHFSGFLIAHICYGFVVIFIAIFFLTVCFKFLYYFPTVNYTLIQFFLPLIILILLRYFLIEFLVKFLFTKNDNRLYKVAPYYIASYFNFFFDCFLGLATCLSRACLTNIISFLTLSRIDVSMFNQESNKKIIKLDRAHLCYLSYLKMEHLYNNPTMNGFCELLIDASIQSNLVEMNLKYKNNVINLFSEAFRANIDGRILENKEIARLKIIDDSKKSSEIIDTDQDYIRNDFFNFESHLRLRNLLFLCLLLKKYRRLSFCRYYQFNISKNNEIRKVETKEMAIRRIIPKKILKLLR